MLALYAMEMNQCEDVATGLKMLQSFIAKAYKLRLFNLGLLVRLADLIRKERAIKESKFLPTEKDRQFSARLAANPYIESLRKDKNLNAQILKLTQTEEEQALVKDLLKSILGKKEYRHYCALENTSPEDERAIVLYIFEKLLPNLRAYREYVEDNYPECLNELARINYSVSQVFESVPHQGMPAEQPSDNAEIVFARELLTYTLQQEERLRNIIQPRLKNWDADRIARIDMILMKMAVCELISFNEIPVKVSINEYIDLAKIYSTPRSKDFINGILDNVMRDLYARNEIVKTGRGLIE